MSPSCQLSNLQPTRLEHFYDFLLSFPRPPPINLSQCNAFGWLSRGSMQHFHSNYTAQALLLWLNDVLR